MSRLKLRYAVAVIVFITVTAFAAAQRVQLTLDTSEAEAVLALVQKRQRGDAITEADWTALFATEPYRRLKQRELSMKRTFTDEDFRNFVLSNELQQSAPALRDTLSRWKTVDLNAAANRVLPYLPDEARIRAKVFPVIKPRSNSFVFDLKNDPSIFLYVDPARSAAVFENTVAHELHHIGIASTDEQYQDKIAALAAGPKLAATYMGAFSEGLAVLAAAGGPEVHPHRFSAAADRERWDRDSANFASDLKRVEAFFRSLMSGSLAGEAAQKQAMEFFGEQGPWYTVGYKMAVMVEKRFGRATLIDCMRDPRQLLSYYNQAAQEQDPPGASLPRWSGDVLTAVGAARPAK